MFFSIIIPTYNCAVVLATCIESLLSQSYKDFEVLILDSLSTDNTLSIIDNYVKSDARIKVYSEKDNGIYDAMNKGVELSSGEYLYFLGSDDALFNDTILENVHAFLRDREGIDVFYGNALLKNSGVLYDGFFDIEKLIFDKNICHQAIFYKRDLFKKMGLYNIKYPTFADWDFNIRCFKNPTLKIEYHDIVIASFNDGQGVSKTFDPVFSKELPAYYIKDNAFKTSYVASIKASLAYRVGKTILFPFSYVKMMVNKFFK